LCAEARQNATTEYAPLSHQTARQIGTSGALVAGRLG
jgi:hypothetical protein